MDRLGRDTVDRANSGRAPVTSGNAPVVLQYQHRSFNRTIRDNVRMGGPLGRKFGEGKKIGHRANRR